MANSNGNVFQIPFIWASIVCLVGGLEHFLCSQKYWISIIIPIDELHHFSGRGGPGPPSSNFWGSPSDHLSHHWRFTARYAKSVLYTPSVGMRLQQGTVYGCPAGCEVGGTNAIHIWMLQNISKLLENWLVGGLEHFLFSYILGIIIPIDVHIFQRGSNHQPVGNLIRI